MARAPAQGGHGMSDAGAERVHYRACTLCEAICGIEIRVRGDDILSIRGDEADPFSRGHVCPKAVALKDLQNDPDRLRQPLIRDGEGWREAGWEEALDAAADRLAAVAQKHGGDAVAVYLGNPSVHNYGTLTHGKYLLGPIRTRSRYSATSVDQLPHQLVCWWLYGHQLLVPIPDIDRCSYFLVLGGNPLASNGSLMTVPDVRARLKALQARCGRLVVVDPRRTETAELADTHLFIRPGTDAAFLLGLLKTVFDENLARPAALADITDGLDRVRELIAGFDLATLSAHCGVSVEAMQSVARAFASADAAVCYGRMGVSTQRHGTLCHWLIQLLNIVTGNLDRPGGLLFTAPAFDLVAGPTAAKPAQFGRWRSRVRGLPEFGGELPVAALAEEIQAPAAEGVAADRIPAPVRALVTVAGNPVLSTPDGPRLATALDRLEAMVCVDFYLNETTRHADVILPPTSALEHDHYDLIFNTFAVRNVARYTEPLFDRPAGALHDWEIFLALGRRLAQRLGGTAPGAPPPHQLIDLGLQAGPYGAMRGHADKLSLKALRAAPHGLDLGPLQPSLPSRLQHQDKRIHAVNDALLAALTAFAAEVTAASPATLRLIGRRHLRSNNSWMHNSVRLVKGPRRDRLQMHPDDLARHGIVDGARVRLRSRSGSVEVDVEASDALMPGVVCLPHGWGHDRDGTRLSVAQLHAGVSYNDVSDPRALDGVSGNAALNGLPVTVEAL